MIVNAPAVLLLLSGGLAFGDVVASLGGSSACLGELDSVLCGSDASSVERRAAGTSPCLLLARNCLSVDIGRRGEVIKLALVSDTLIRGFLRLVPKKSDLFVR